MNVKGTMFFGQDKWGWTESWFWEGAGLGLEAAEADFKQLGIYRREILDGTVSLEAIRLSVCDGAATTFETGVSEIRYDSITDGNGAIFTDTCNNPWTALYVRFYSQSKTYARNYLIRGIPDSFTCIPIVGAIVPYSIPNKLSKALRTLLDYICSNKNSMDVVVLPTGVQAGASTTGTSTGGSVIQVAFAAPGGGGALPFPVVTPPLVRSAGRFSFAPVQRKGARNTPTPLKDVAVEDQDDRIVILPYPGVTFKTGERIHLHGIRSAGQTGMNGDTKIKGQIAGAGPFSGYYATTKKVAGHCDVTDPSSAVFWRIKKFLVAPTTAEVGRIVHRSTGGAYFGTVGKGASNKK